MTFKSFLVGQKRCTPQTIFDKRDGEDTLLFDFGSDRWLRSTWLLAREIMPRSRFCFYSALISYVFVAYPSNSWADLFCLFDNDLDLILYTQQSLFSSSLFHFISFFCVRAALICAFVPESGSKFVFYIVYISRSKLVVFSPNVCIEN